jgi:hypothetical protein
MDDFRSRRQLHSARQSITKKEDIPTKPVEVKSDKKKKINFKINREDDFRQGTRVKDMKELIERRYTQDASNKITPSNMTEENKTTEFDLNNMKYNFLENEYEECKSHRVDNEQSVRFKRGSMRILYMAKALEVKLHQKKDDINDRNRDDHVLQMMMDKPAVNNSKKPSRVKMSL